MKDDNQICLATGPIQIHISLYLRALYMAIVIARMNWFSSNEGSIAPQLSLSGHFIEWPSLTLPPQNKQTQDVLQLPLLLLVENQRGLSTSVTSKKLPNVYKSCAKLILLEKWKFFKSLQKLP